MERITQSFEQGSLAWHQFRADHYGASEASAVLGMSPYKTRDALLHEKATGLTAEVSESTQKVFDNGHRVESLARPIVEKLIGMDLYPVTVSFGKLSASSDGLSMCETTAWECKQLNKAHFLQVNNGELPEIHWPQCQQVLYVTGAEKLYFTVTDGTEENTAGVWVYPNAEQQQTILDAWAQFSIDLENYVPPVIVEKVEAETIKALPVPSVVVRGEITASNLGEITPMFDEYLGAINTELSTDQQFADAEANSKNCRDMATRIKALRANIIAQMVDVNAVDGVLSNYEEAFNKVGLRLEKAVKEQKETIKTNAVLKTKLAYAAHVQALEAEIAPIRLNLPMPDFAGSFKNVKSLDTMHSRLNDALASGKIAADAMARDIRAKLSWYKQRAAGFDFLFADLQGVINLPKDHFELKIESRIADHLVVKQHQEAKIKADAEAALLAKQAAETVATNHIVEANKMVEVKPSVLPQSMQAEFGNIFTPAIVPTQYFAGATPTVNEIVTALAIAFKVDELQAHKYLIDADFTKWVAEKKAA